MPVSPPGDLPDPGIKSKSPKLAGGVFTTETLIFPLKQGNVDKHSWDSPSHKKSPLVQRDQSCPTLFNPEDCSPTGSPVHVISHARILEWVSISFLGDIPNPGVELTSPVSLALQVNSLPAEPSSMGRELCQPPAAAEV